MARWLHRHIGGNIKLLTAVNQENKKTPDYLWNGKYWDLKSISTEKAADSAIRHGLKQIADNPGGVILKYVGNDFSLSEIKKVSVNRLRRSRALGVEVIILINDDLIFAIRNK